MENLYVSIYDTMIPIDDFFRLTDQRENPKEELALRDKVLKYFKSISLKDTQDYILSQSLRKLTAKPPTVCTSYSKDSQADTSVEITGTSYSKPNTDYDLGQTVSTSYSKLEMVLTKDSLTMIQPVPKSISLLSAAKMAEELINNNTYDKIVILSNGEPTGEFL